MKALRILVIGYSASKDLLSFRNSYKTYIAYFSSKTNVFVQILLTLAKYFVAYSKKFDTTRIYTDFEGNKIFPNGTLKGLFQKINLSKIDIAIQPTFMNKERMEVVDFSYPFQLYSFTFITTKPTKKPQLFGIFQTFSTSVWIAILSTILVMLIVNYATLKKKYSLDKICLHVFAIFLRQSTILKTSSLSANILLCAWVAGAMVICLAYDSVFLSFLSFPPVTKIQHLTDLALAVKNKDYHCMANPDSSLVLDFLMRSEEKTFNVIASDILSNNLSNVYIIDDFIRDSRKQKLALLTEAINIPTFAGKYFVSQDRFYESMGAFMVRKDFCCKNILEMFVHRLMGSGLYFKCWNDRSFLNGLPLLLKHPENDSNDRKITLTHVAPAFTFLLIGYVISTLVFILELVINRKRKMNHSKKFKKRKKTKIRSDISV